MIKEIAFGIVIGILLVCVIALFCVLLIKLYIRKIKEHNIKELAFQKTLNEAVIETQEQVLNNISQDLHDDAGQQLTYINFQLENLKLDSPELQTVLTPVSQSVNQLSESIRSISHALNNELLLQQDLIKAIENEINRVQKNAKVSIVYSFTANKKKVISANEKIFIYRIFQECINNCLKHAKADKIEIIISTMPEFEMTITDNGKGFDQEKIISHSSVGLSNMKARAHSIGYHLEIQSGIDKGTTVKLSEVNKT